MGVFFNEPTKEHYLIEISKKAGIAHTSTKSYLIELEKKGIIDKKTETKGKRKFPVYMANLDNPGCLEMKRSYNHYKIIRSGIIKFLKDKLMPGCIVLFGSFQRGEDTEDSDIDIYVEAKRESINLSVYEKALSRKIELHFKKDFREYPKELKNNIINGLVLSGYLRAL